MWLYQLLVAARGIFIASFRIFHCCTQILFMVQGLSHPCLRNLSSPTRAWIHVPCIARQILTHWPTREVPEFCMNSWCIFGYLPLIRTMTWKYFLPFHRLSFHIVNGLLYYAEAFQFDVILVHIFVCYFCF